MPTLLIPPDWVIAEGCGKIQDKDQWTQLVDKDLTVSHLCHKCNCRNKHHVTL